MHKETFDKLLDSVKKHEGYRNKVYLDTLNKRTVGVGHLCVEDFWEDDKEYEEKSAAYFDDCWTPKPMVDFLIKKIEECL